MNNDSYSLSIDMAGKDTKDKSVISLFCRNCHTFTMVEMIDDGQTYFVDIPKKCPVCQEREDKNE